LFASSEIALAAFGENRIEELKEKDDKYIPCFEQLNRKQEEVFGAIHFVITFFNVLIAISGYFLFYFLIYPQLSIGDQSINTYAFGITLFIATLIVTFIIIIFTVLVPKVIAYKYSEFIGKRSIKIILILSGVLKYVTSTATLLSNIILIPFKEKTGFYQDRPSEDEILEIISDGVKTGTIDETEQEIIKNIFEFNDLKADEVMIPRTEMIAVNLNDKDNLNIEKIIKTGHTLVPVYENSLDNISGVLHTKDVMKSLIEGNKLNLKYLVRPAYFVPETKSISEILKEMQKHGERIAIVTDEYGGTEGVITMEDILEEIVGEFKDKTDNQVSTFNKLPDGKYYILGSINIEEFNELFNYQLPESDEYNTLAGFISERTGKILNPGEKFIHENLVFELIKKIRQKMVQFKVYSVQGNFSEVADTNDK
jgi:putative hemolysin